MGADGPLYSIFKCMAQTGFGRQATRFIYICSGNARLVDSVRSFHSHNGTISFLTRNLLKIPADQILDMEIEMIIVDGKIVYQRKSPL